MLLLDVNMSPGVYAGFENLQVVPAPPPATAEQPSWFRRILSHASGPSVRRTHPAEGPRVLPDGSGVLFARSGSDTVPTLLTEDGTALVGESEILAYLERHYGESEQAEAHRAKAAKARHRYLEEECGCSPLATR